jgi:hypothetical protein
MKFTDVSEERTGSTFRVEDILIQQLRAELAA